jgi:hypothetical protein
MDERTLARTLDHDRAEWELLTSILDAHPDGPVHDPESPEWEARHVYAHLWRWISHSMDDFEAVLAGRARPTPPEGGDDEVNARWRAEDDALSLEEARERASAAYERRIRLVGSVRPEEWTPLLEAVANADGWQHFAGHRNGIERADR